MRFSYRAVACATCPHSQTEGCQPVLTPSHRCCGTVQVAFGTWRKIVHVVPAPGRGSGAGGAVALGAVSAPQ